ncbi:MAG: CcoQ/FixQ family Cbb3-type cytochrome c oxidase assembly chaperone [Calditerrivibrio sp.]|nr:CcoQ/FixQ family Cbb3-type cytochrome c oxidase assembly chaperone [Calditerrivibrio sp.]MCA1932221.1 CcoQ/FixQ family Cbb3-type cytochrome c oxidase assembly chaperone [Calditerrivibrio sp.]
MAKDHIFLIVFGFTLVFLLVFFMFYYYSKGRKDKIESAKYKMLEDDEDGKI